MEIRTETTVRITAVHDKRDLQRFIRFPWLLYAHDPAWVPPLLGEQKKILDRARHPFHQHAEVEYFLARRGNRVLGRIAAIANHRYNEFHEDRTGFFGFFEVVEDGDVATQLLASAEAWLEARGMDTIVGPMNFSTNDESHSPGILIDGFDTPPFVLMAHGRPYYQRLVEEAGYEKANDLLAYLFSSNEAPRRIARAVGRIERGIEGLEIRHMDLRQLPHEVEIVKEIYNSAWERNWGFVPLTDEEISHLASDLKPILEPRYALVASIHGEPVGFSLTLPDFNQALRHVNGRLFPFGLLKLLWYARRINRARVFALGLKPEHRTRGIDAILYLKTFETADALGHLSGESSWILEDNWPMRRALEKMGAHVHKTYRVYQKRLGRLDESGSR